MLLRRLTAFASFAAIIVAALGPWFCQAAMASPSPKAMACCWGGSCGAGSDREAPVKPLRKDCPLHEIANIRVLNVKAPQIPAVPILFFPAWQQAAAPGLSEIILPASPLARHGGPIISDHNLSLDHLSTLQLRC